MKSLSILGISFLMSFANAAPAGAPATDLKLDKGHVEFLAVAKPGSIKVRGKGDALTAKMQLQDSKLIAQFIFDMTSIETGISMRDDHTKNKYLEVSKFPKSQLTLNPVSFAKNICKEKFSAEHQAFSGTQQIHGVEKPVQGEFDIKAEGNSHGHTQVRYHVSLKDFNIESPTYMGITVGDQIENTVDLDWSCP